MSYTSKVCRLGSLPYAELYNLITWCTSPVDVDNESTLVGSARNEKGEPVAYVAVEPTFLVNAYAISPELSKGDAGQAGDAIDNQLSAVAEQVGVARFLIILPSDAPPQPDERTLRYIERTTAPRFETRHLTLSTPSPSVYVN